jgi:ABC-type ATPase with predicted acetyltransferase domain
MATEHSLPTQDGYQSDAVVIQMRCDCGNWLKAETRNQQVSCECGKSFAVTITEIYNSVPFTD